MCNFKGNKLRQHLEDWKNIGANNDVLLWIKNGINIPFKSLPDNFSFPNRQFKRHEAYFIRTEIKRLLQAECIKKVNTKPVGVSPLGVVPKKDNKLRLIIDLRHLNSYCEARSVIYEDIKTVIDIVEPDDCIVTADIKHGFHHIGVNIEYQKYLGFQFENQYYVWCVLPFGASFSPYFFSKTLRPVVQYLRQNNVKNVCYVDDFLATDAEDLIEGKKNFLVQTLNRLGLTINFPKSNLTPSKSQIFIGYIISTNKEPKKIFIQIPATRIKRLKHDINRALRRGFISARALAKITGQCISMSKAILPAKLLLRNIYRDLSKRLSWQDVITLSKSATKDLKWWLDSISAWNGRSFETKETDIIQVTCDASKTGFGAKIVGSPIKAQAIWDPITATRSSNYRELKAVLYTLTSFLTHLKSKAVSIYSDNITTVANVNFMGSKHTHLSQLARQIWTIAIQNQISLQVKHIRGIHNLESDQLSRLPQKYEWTLHPDIFNYIDKKFGKHTIDRFASLNTFQVEKYNSRFLDPLSSGFNALEQNDWHQHNNYVNPPFRLLPDILRLIIRQKAKATVIAPWWPAMTWFKTLEKLSTTHPIKLPQPSLICFPVQNTTPEPCRNTKWRLYAWRIDGDKHY